MPLKFFCWKKEDNIDVIFILLTPIKFPTDFTPRKMWLAETDLTGLLLTSHWSKSKLSKIQDQSQVSVNELNALSPKNTLHERQREIETYY